MNLLSRCVMSMAAVLILNTHAFADPKVDVAVMVPKTANITCFISPHGLHFAAVVPKGSRAAIYYDGAEGQKFDQILSPDGNAYAMPSSGIPMLSSAYQHGPVVFSPDDQHYAYAAESNNNYVIIEDGNQVAQGPWFQNIFGGGYLKFSPQGDHLFYTINDNIPNHNGYHLVVDGKANPWSISPPVPIFSADGKHYVYTGTEQDSTTQFSVLDGAKMPYMGDNPQFTDNDHLLSVLYNNQVDYLIADGKPMMKAVQISQVAVSSKGAVTLAVVNSTPNSGLAQNFLTANRQPVPNTQGVQIVHTYFSPDGLHYAALCQTPNNTKYMVVDGKKQQNYPSIDLTMTPFFSPDSSKFLYLGQSGQDFLVINGDESDDGFQGLAPTVTFSADGKRMAYGTYQSNRQNYTVTVDGKVLPPFKDTPEQLFTFSPDGSRYAFAFLSGMRNLVVDGVQWPNIMVNSWSRMNSDMSGTVVARYLFSPDSKHIVFSGQDTTNSANRGLYVDQTLVYKATSMQPNRAVFTPDSQHLFWEGREAPNATMPGWHYQVYVDGKPSIAYAAQTIFDNYDPTWSMGDNGVLTVYTVESDGIKKYTITPPADTNISTMLAAAGGK